MPLLLAVATMGLPNNVARRDFHLSPIHFEISAAYATGDIPSGQLWHALRHDFKTGGIYRHLQYTVHNWTLWRVEVQAAGRPATTSEDRISSELDKADRAWRAEHDVRWEQLKAGASRPA